MNASQVKKELRLYIDETKAPVLQSFFKTGKGQYGEGDRFLGVAVPHQRQVAKKYVDLSYKYIKKLLLSKYHEERLTALLILTYKLDRSDKNEIVNITQFYIKNIEAVNNWDLVDVTAPRILGAYFFENERTQLYIWAKSSNLWIRRISIVSTFYFIKRADLDDTFKIAKLLLHDREDLIHKAVGWMLREAGKQDIKRLKKFIFVNYSSMPRTMLRYAIEKLSVAERRSVLKAPPLHWKNYND